MSGSGVASTFAFTFNLFHYAAELLQKVVVAMLWFYIQLVESTPEPHLTAGWFRGEFGVMWQISCYLMIPIVFAATLGSLMHGGVQQILRTYLWALPIGVLGGVAVIALVEINIDVDNQLTRAVFKNTTKNVQVFFDAVNENTKGDSSAQDFAKGYGSYAWTLVQALIMFVMLFLILFLVLEMFFRNVMIYMGALFIPLSLAAYIWGPVRVWFYNLCELVFTMIYAKFITAAVVSFGFTAMAYGMTGDGDASTAALGVWIGSLIVLVIACMSGPVLVAFIMSPNHAILSFKAAKQVSPLNHDRKFAGDLFKSSYKSAKGLLTGSK